MMLAIKQMMSGTIAQVRLLVAAFQLASGEVSCPSLGWRA
jgi:hypothetical protein